MAKVVIAGTHSGVGKTTISIAVLRSFRNMGMVVAPFKVGPDFIDPKFHTFATGNCSYNLDAWMLGEETIKYLFKKNYRKKELAVIEGVMGLYDGADVDGLGSTAHIAKIINAPVILVIDAHAISTSIAAIINGFKKFDRDLNLKGVILNNLSSEGHYLLLKNIIAKYTDAECFGYLPLKKNIILNSRHLGLVPVEELVDLDEKIDILSKDVEKYINIERIREVANEFDEISSETNVKYCIEPDTIYCKDLRIAIARDEAFSFYYQDNLDLLIESGAELIEFSPLVDSKLPENINCLYLGGGFPEEFAEILSKNYSMRSEIKEKAENGLPIYAECGGLMYLTSAIIDKRGKSYAMVDFFKCKSRMTERLQRFGYVEIEFEDAKTRAHEFHHSVLENINDKDIEYKFKITQGDKSWSCGLSRKNVLAAYAHVHFYSNLNFTKKILKEMMSYSN